MALDRNVHVCTLVLLITVTSCVRGVSETVGHIFQTTSAKEEGARGIFLLENFELDEGVVYKMSALCVRTNPVRFQVWRPTSDDKENQVYTLVGEQRLVPHVVPMVYNVTLQFPFIFTLFGDRVGIYNEEDTCPVGYQFVEDTQDLTKVYQYSLRNSSVVQPGMRVTFDTMPMPFKFSISVTYDTDKSAYTTPGEEPPTTESLPSSDIPDTPTGEGTLQYKGNTLESREFFRQDEAKVTYILPHVVLGYGVVVGFYAFFMRSEPVWFQIWRPVHFDDVTPADDDVYTLVGQIMYIPEMTPLRHKVELNSSSYIFVEEGDVLGFTNGNDVGPIGYSLLDDPSLVGPLSANLIDNKLPYVGQKVKFSNMRMPYHYAVGVMYDTVADPNLYGTPPPWPPQTTTSTTTTTFRFTQPPDDDSNRIIGIDNLFPTDKVLEHTESHTYVMADVIFPEKGRVTSFWAYFLKPGTIQLQIWRQVYRSGKLFRLVGRKWYAPQLLGEFVEVKFEPGYEVDVEPGDCIGFYNEDTETSIGYTFDYALVYTLRGGSDVTVDDVIDFDALSFPHKFSLGASYIPHDKLSTTTTTIRPTTYSITDSTSALSDHLSTSQPSMSSAQSSTQTTGETAEVVSEDEDSWLTDPVFILIIFVWLILLSLLFVVLCCIVLRRRHKPEEGGVVYGSAYTPRAVSRTPSAIYGSPWLNGMKEDEGIDYLNPRISLEQDNGGFDQNIVHVQNVRNNVEMMTGRESFYDEIADVDHNGRTHAAVMI